MKWKKKQAGTRIFFFSKGNNMDPIHVILLGMEHEMSLHDICGQLNLVPVQKCFQLDKLSIHNITIAYMGMWNPLGHLNG